MSAASMEAGPSRPLIAAARAAAASVSVDAPMDDDTDYIDLRPQACVRCRRLWPWAHFERNERGGRMISNTVCLRCADPVIEEYRWRFALEDMETRIAMARSLHAPGPARSPKSHTKKRPRESWPRYAPLPPTLPSTRAVFELDAVVDLPPPPPPGSRPGGPNNAGATTRESVGQSMFRPDPSVGLPAPVKPGGQGYGPAPAMRAGNDMDLAGIEEPRRAVIWLVRHYRSTPHPVPHPPPQIETYRRYIDTFKPASTAPPMMYGSEFVELVPKVFPGVTLIHGTFAFAGLERVD